MANWLLTTSSESYQVPESWADALYFGELYDAVVFRGNKSLLQLPTFARDPDLATSGRHRQQQHNKTVTDRPGWVPKQPLANTGAILQHGYRTHPQTAGQHAAVLSQGSTDLSYIEPVLDSIQQADSAVARCGSR
jgi:hypothetical protein